MPGLTLTGFEAPTLADLREKGNAAWRLVFGSSMDVSDRSPDGQMLGSMAERFALIWEGLEAIVQGLDRDKAIGAALVSLVALTGTEPRLPSYSTVTLTLTGTPTTEVAAGALVSTVSTGQQFITVTDIPDATIAAAPAWAGATSYAVGDRVTNAGNVYLCITAGTSAGSGGPDDESEDGTDGTAHWRFLGTGTGYIDVLARATETGPIVAVSGDLTEIDTPIGGWDGVVNILDAEPGLDAMTNAELRALQELEIALPGTCTQNAVRAALLEVDGVTSATVFVNNSDVTDGDGVPPHAIECLVAGGDDQDIWDALLENVAVGIKTYGTETGTANDSEGTAHAMAFSRSTEIDAYVSLHVEIDPSAFPDDGEDQIKAAVAEAGNALGNGADIRAGQIARAAGAIDGVLDVLETRVYTDVIATGAAWSSTTAYSATAGARSVVTNDDRAYICITSGTSAGSGGPTGAGTDITDGTVHWRFLGATVPIGTRQVALYDTSRITVTTTDGVP